jgi:PTS system ascorbate-specific IIA component
MSVGVLIVTHPGIGSALAHSAQRIMGDSPLKTFCLDIPVDSDVERTEHEISQALANLDAGDGVIILSDIFGATPNNLARKFAAPGHVHIVSGVNLPMLIRLYNYPNTDLAELCELAAEGGQRGIMTCAQHL